MKTIHLFTAETGKSLNLHWDNILNMVSAHPPLITRFLSMTIAGFVVEESYHQYG